MKTIEKIKITISTILFSSLPSLIFADGKISGNAGVFDILLNKLKSLLGNLSFLILELLKYVVFPVVLYCIFVYTTTTLEQKRAGAIHWGVGAVILGVLAWSGALKIFLEALFG